MSSSQGMHDIVEGLPGDELHGDIMQSGLLTDAIDRHDVCMVQVRRRLSLTLEPLQCFGSSKLWAGSTFQATCRPRETCSAS